MKPTMRWTAYGSALLLALAILAAAPARAQQGEDSDTGVARISLLRGDVFMTRGDSGDRVEAKINMPLVRGDKIFTDEKSQTEIQLDHSNIIRLAPKSEIRIADLTRKQIQIQVAQGLVNYTVFKTNEAEVEIDTPNMAVRPVKEGFYRIQVTSPTETSLIVRKGDADVTTPEGTARVEEGRIIMVRGAENPEYQIAKAPARDDWDKWNKDRDKVVQEARSYKYANRYYTGAHDLDRHGRWVYVPDYGDWCWTPYVNAGWIPYHYGYWGWAPYWGWTWISYEPWGWAPYHYGRWFYWGSAWYWWPGHRYYGYRPLWGPGWVSFVGFGFGGHNWGFGFGYGYSSIGWCPLGPYDRYYPWWGRHNSYKVVNITNITNINNGTIINRGGRGHGGFGRDGYSSNLEAALTNSRVRGAITRIATDDFMRGNFSRAQRGIDANTLREGQLVQGRIPVAPTRETLRPTDRMTRASFSGTSDRFFSRREAPAVSRSFSQQAGAVQEMMRTYNPLGGAARREAGEVVAAGRGFGNSSATTPGTVRDRGADATPEARGTSQPGWRGFGRTDGELAQRGAQGAKPAGQAGQPAQGTPATERNWRRFGTGQPRVDPARPTTTGTEAAAPAGQARGGEMPAPRIEGGNRQEGRSDAAAPSTGGWRRFGNRSGNAGGSDRRALDIRKPITTERGLSGGGRFGQSGAAAPRGFERRGPTGEPGGNSSAPRRFERSAPSGGFGGGDPRRFERSVPSGGSGGFGGSTPRTFERISPSGGSGGGNRGWSAPSGGFGGGAGTGRGGWSAPSGGGRSAPSGGGGRSAPSGGRGHSGGPSGRR